VPPHWPGACVWSGSTRANGLAGLREAMHTVADVGTGVRPHKVRRVDPLADLAALEGVGSAMAAGRDGIDALLRDRGLRRTAPELTAESLLLGAHASAVLDGSSVTVDELRDGATDAPAAAALRVSTEVLGLVPVLAHSPLQAFARLHTLAAKGALADSDLGRPRDRAAAERLTALGRLLLDRSSAPALVSAAVVHAELVTVAPFASHNGIVARAAERLVMVARGVDPTSLTVPEAGHLALRPQYESNLIGYVEGGAVGVHAWLLYAAEAYTAGAQASPLRNG
jgi:hypothetical protein